MSWSDVAAYAGLFATAFAAATILPFQSEAALATFLLADVQPAWSLIVVASVGNILGSAANYALGRGIERFRDRGWFPIKTSMLLRAQDWYRHYGVWSLLASWVPIIGDPLTVAAGVMRERLAVFLIFVTIAKASRYLVLASIVESWF